MADILIRGLDMPKKGNPLTVLIYPDGTATWKDREYKAIPVPPHGRLIDADALFEVMGQDTERWLIDDISYIETDDAISAVYKAPTIVPAEGGNADGN